MKLYNIKQRDEEVTFLQALMKGLGKNQGLFFPKSLLKFSASKISMLLEMNFIDRSAYILSKYIGSELSEISVLNCVKSAFNFPIPLVDFKNNISILELFHGPTLAFKDFGSRLMAQMLIQVKHYCNKPIVILTATSGDTGAAVAHAFYGLKNIYVIILYPKGKISFLQEKLFCTLGKNIFTVLVDGDFDVCQSLVKKAFDDDELRNMLFLNSANSINFSRLLAQICYYFEAISQCSCSKNRELVVSVPSGNFGNITAGLLAQSCGLPISKFIIATNCNDTVPRFLKFGLWDPRPTISTFSNAMDVSNPSNWDRIIELFYRENRSIKELGYGCVNDKETKETIQEMAELGYIADPHTAVAYRLLRDQLKIDEFGICLSTAHPAKFKDLVEHCLKEKVKVLLPCAIKKRIKLPILSYEISDSFFELRNLIVKIIS